MYLCVCVCVCENFNFHAFLCLGKHEDMKNVLRIDCVRVIGVYNNVYIYYKYDDIFDLLFYYSFYSYIY